MVLACKKFTSISSTLVSAALLMGCASSEQVHVTRASQLDQLIASEDARECRFNAIRTDVYSEIMARDDSVSFIRNLEALCPEMAFAFSNADPEQVSQSAFLEVFTEESRSRNGSPDGRIGASDSTRSVENGTSGSSGSGSTGGGSGGAGGGSSTGGESSGGGIGGSGSSGGGGGTGSAGGSNSGGDSSAGGSGGSSTGGSGTGGGSSAVGSSSVDGGESGSGNNGRGKSGGRNGNNGGGNGSESGASPGKGRGANNDEN